MTISATGKRRMILAGDAGDETLLCMTAGVDIKAGEGDGDKKGPAKFDVLAYNGKALRLNGWDLPVVIDLEGMKFGNSLIANLDHDRTKRVGNVTAKEKTQDRLELSGIVSAATPYASEVVESAGLGFVWQASVEATADVVTEVPAGESVEVNGQDFEGPLYVAQKSTLKGFAFVSHGADDDTSVNIAAIKKKAAPPKKAETKMDPEFKAWLEAMHLDPESLTADQLTGLKANYEGKNTPPKKKPTGIVAGFEAKKAEAERKEKITEYALNACDRAGCRQEMDEIKELAERAIEASWDFDKFRLELMEAQAPGARSPFVSSKSDQKLDDDILAAAVCESGRLQNLDKHFNERTLDAAHERFPHGISLNQLLLMGAEANGYRSNHSSKITIDAQRAAFGMMAPTQIRAAGFSTISIPNVLAETANKFLMEGWNAIDMTPLAISAVRAVSDFKTITTVSLTGDMQFEKVGSDGEIKHGDLGDLTYTNKADTYARMLAITRTDLINDDLGALTAVPRRIGRGGALKLNDIFWTEFLNNSSFFSVGNNNVSTATGTLTVAGLAAAETIFMSQTDPDGNPLGVMPAILLVPTAQKTAALQLMNSERLAGGTDPLAPDANIWRGRFRVESSPYMHNSSYTGYSAAAWYMLANPGDMPVIEIAALNGRVEPLVESADADFNVLGVQMRGYSDVGVSKQEYRGGVRASGS